MINRFIGEYEFLSNFYPCKFKHLEIKYNSVEHFYCAHKTKDRKLRMHIASIQHPGAAKKYARTIPLREDWEEVKLRVMECGIEYKFTPGSALAQSLMDTHPHELIEGNHWGDTFWGVDLKSGEGYNHLGKILMNKREKLIGGKE